MSRAARQRLKEEQDRRRVIHSDWARRHPDLARQERQLRARNAQIAEDFGHKVHGTVQTHAHASTVRQGSIARLYRSGAITIDHLGWSQEIAAAHEMIVAEVRIPVASLETRVDQSRSAEGTFFEKLGAVRLQVAYSRWRAQLPAPAAPCLAMIIDDLGIAAAARRFGMHHRRARKLLIDALELWPDCYREARDEVDEATLLAAQSGLL